MLNFMLERCACKSASIATSKVRNVLFFPPENYDLTYF